MVRKRIVWCGKFPTQIIMTTILRHDHSVPYLQSGRGQILFQGSTSITPHCPVHSVTLRGLTLNVLDLEPYGRSQVSLEIT